MNNKLKKTDVKTGVIIMTYGSATIAENVGPYMQAIYGGKASHELIEDFENRYRLVGYSPLIEITSAQAQLLQKKLGAKYVVDVGMRHSGPTIASAVARCKKRGAKKLVGIILSPQFSSFIMDGYRTAFAKAAHDAGYADASIAVAEPWPTERHFIRLLAKNVRESLTKLEKIYDSRVPVIFTTHSLPERVVKQDPSYVRQLQATIAATIKELKGRKKERQIEYYSGYQSAGHTPEAWLKPDLVDILSDLKKKKARAVLIAPIQFLADHLEILFDLDIEGARQCAEHTIAYNRIKIPNTDPLFIEALATTAKQTKKSL